MSHYFLLTRKAWGGDAQESDLMNLGFTLPQARAALKKYAQNLEYAAGYLLDGGAADLDDDDDDDDHKSAVRIVGPGAAPIIMGPWVAHADPPARSP